MMKFEEKVKKEAEKLLKKDERIMVALSGGKDSMTMLYLLNKWGYNPEAIMINVDIKGFKEHLENSKSFCKEQGIKLYLVSVEEELGKKMTRIQDESGMNNCMACGVIKRYLLNKKARELGIDKLVTGHNLNDHAESVIMNLVMNNPRACLNLGEKTGVIDNELFVKKVKPLNNIQEKEIKDYADKNNLPVSNKACPRSSNAFRRQVKNLLKKYNFNQENITKHLKKIKPLIKKKCQTRDELRTCNECGEPSRGETCNTCQLL